MLTHFIFTLFFYAIEVYQMAIYNVGSTLFFALMIYLSMREYNVRIIFLLTSIEVVLHAYLATYYVGTECDFILFIFLLPSVFLLNPKWKLWQATLYFISILIAYYLSRKIFNSPIYVLDENIILYSSIVITLTIAIVIFLVIFYYSKIVNLNDVALRKANKELLIKNEGKNAIIKEIHHRIKNNLQVVISLLRLQSSKVKDENVVNMFKETQKRIFSMALLHEKMQQEYDLESIDVQAHFKLLIENLVESYAVGKNIKLDIKIDKINLGMQTLTPLGLIINEMITNSLKYAFNGSNKGTIKVHIKQLNESTYEMIISDNGIGLTKDEKSIGIGKKLIKIFVRQLNGRIDRLDEKGTSYKVIFEEIIHT